MSSTVAKRLRSLSDPGRLRVLGLISASGELCVCEIEKIVGLTVSTASRNLRDLEDAGWLASRRDGRWIYYRLAEMDGDWEDVRREVLEVFARTAQAQQDLNRRDELLPKDRLAMCREELSLENFYRQMDHDTK